MAHKTALLTALFLLTTLASCGSDTSSEGGSGSTTADGTTTGSGTSTTTGGSATGTTSGGTTTTSTTGATAPFNSGTLPSNATTCKTQTSTTCTADTWTNFASAKITSACGDCHGNYETCGIVLSNSAAIASRLQGGSMPPSGSTPALSAADRQRLLTWINCNLPL